MNLSENLKRIRKEHNLSQEQLAEKLGVSRQSVSKWESDLAYPELDKIVQLSTLFNINVDDLLHKNIEEVSKEKQSITTTNKILDSFLSYITKSIDMFCSMKLKAKLKCIFEQIVIVCILFTIFLILAAIGNYVAQGLLLSLPRSIYRIVVNILSSLYILSSIILGTALTLYIFKIRYLDYYEIVREQSQIETILEPEIYKKNIEKSAEEKQIPKKIWLEKKKEKIIIRNPEGKDYKFIKGLLKIVVLFMKMMLAFVAFGIAMMLIALIVSFVCTFLIIKTGLFFLGLAISFLAAIMMTFVILESMMNIIINRKNNKKRNLYLFLSSLIIMGIGIGLTIIGCTKFQYIDNLKEPYYNTSTKYIEMQKDLVIGDSPYYYLNYEFINEEREDIKIEYVHSTFTDLNIHTNSTYTYFTIRSTDDILTRVRTQLKDLNDFKIIDYEKIEIKVYASLENIEILKKNNKKYYNREARMEKQFQEFYKRERQYENKISKLEDEIVDLKDKILELENDNLSKPTIR